MSNLDIHDVVKEQYDKYKISHTIIACKNRMSKLDTLTRILSKRGITSKREVTKSAKFVELQISHYLVTVLY